jgi:hypothetical protein
MASWVCIGGMLTDSGGAVRPLPREDRGAHGHPPQAPYQPGELWEMTLRPRAHVEPPHVEDHDAWDAVRIGAAPDPAAMILELDNPIADEPEVLFEGRLRFRETGTAYLTREEPVPRMSVTFWLPPRALVLDYFEHRPRYSMQGEFPFQVPYVGFAEPARVIPAGTLVRLSLARWWTNPNDPGEDETCSVQMSGWFGLEGGR